MGDRQEQALRARFDGKLKLEFQRAKVTGDAGLFAFRDLDEAFRLTAKANAMLSDFPHGRNTQHSILVMLRQSVYGRLAGYEDVKDADRLPVDPAIRHVLGGRAKKGETASTSEMNRFETEIPSSRLNLMAPMDPARRWVDLVQECAPLDQLTLDMDSSQSETCSDQQGSAYNGHFDCTCYHRLILFDQHGDLERAMLRRWNHASTKFVRRVLCPVIERYRGRDISKDFGRDAAFAISVLHRLLEEEGFKDWRAGWFWLESDGSHR